MVNMLKGTKGFTLIEIMVVVVILGILAGIVVPRLLDEPEKARRTSAATQIRSLEEALGMFKLDNGFYPSTEQGLQSLVNKPSIGRIPARYKEGRLYQENSARPMGTTVSVSLSRLTRGFRPFLLRPGRRIRGRGRQC